MTSTLRRTVEPHTEPTDPENFWLEYHWDQIKLIPKTSTMQSDPHYIRLLELIRPDYPIVTDRARSIVSCLLRRSINQGQYRLAIRLATSLNRKLNAEECRRLLSRYLNQSEYTLTNDAAFLDALRENLPADSVEKLLAKEHAARLPFGHRLYPKTPAS